MGSDILLQSITSEGTVPNSAKERVLSLVRKSFRPEFLNRLDEIIVFDPLTRQNLKKMYVFVLTVFATVYKSACACVGFHV